MGAVYMRERGVVIMETLAPYIQSTVPVSEIAERCITAVRNGDVSPLSVWADLTKVERICAAVKADAGVFDDALDEMNSYGGRAVFGDIVLEQAEAGVKYDYSACGDSKLAEMYELRKRLDADIKEREKMLKNLPASGMADPETGEMLYPAPKFSKTIIKSTVKK